MPFPHACYVVFYFCVLVLDCLETASLTLFSNYAKHIFIDCYLLAFTLPYRQFQSIVLSKTCKRTRASIRGEGGQKKEPSSCCTGRPQALWRGVNIVMPRRVFLSLELEERSTSLISYHSPRQQTPCSQTQLCLVCFKVPAKS